MSRFLKKTSEIAFSVFSSLSSDFKKPNNWPKNWVPIAERDRLARYGLLDAVNNNYLGVYLRNQGILPTLVDEKGRLIEQFQGYGEAKKIAGLLANAILGDKVNISSDNKTVKDIWKNLLRLKIHDAEDKAS